MGQTVRDRQLKVLAACDAASQRLSDKVKLQELVDRATEAQQAFWDALNAIERFVGTDIDDLESTIDTHDAESILQLVGR